MKIKLTFDKSQWFDVKKVAAVYEQRKQSFPSVDGFFKIEELMMTQKGNFILHAKMTNEEGIVKEDLYFKISKTEAFTWLHGNGYKLHEIVKINQADAIHEV